MDINYRNVNSISLEICIVRMKNIRFYIYLHIMIAMYTISGICSKKASECQFLDVKFLVYYAIIIAILGIYAISWQQIIKKIPLSVAYANKAVTIIWGMIWGMLIFHEKITIWKVFGSILVMAGILLFVTSDKEDKSVE